MKNINEFTSIIIEDHNDYCDVYAACKINIAVSRIKNIEINDAAKIAALKINEIIYGGIIQELLEIKKAYNHKDQNSNLYTYQKIERLIEKIREVDTKEMTIDIIKPKISKTN